MLHQDKTCSKSLHVSFGNFEINIFIISLYIIIMVCHKAFYYLNAYYVLQQECTVVAYSCGFVRLHIRRVAL